jgi:hypothetical protein
VLRDPEAAGRRMALVLAVACAALVFASGWLLAPAYGIGLALLFQAWPFAFAAVWGMETAVTPDFLVLCLSQLFCALLLRFAPSPKLALSGGGVLGLMLASKVTALLFLGAPLVFFRRRWAWAAQCYGVAAAVAASLIAVLYRSKIKYFLAYTLHWFVLLATHQGWYGDGQTGVPGAGVLVGNVAGLALAIPQFFLAAALCLALTPRFLRADFLVRDRWLIFAAVTLGQVVLVSKAAEVRYVFPALPAAGGALVLLLDARPLALRAAGAVVGVLVVIACAANFTVAQRFRDEALAATALVPDRDTVARVCARGGSDVGCALYFGSNFSHKLFSAELARLYPRFLSWDGNPAGDLVDMNDRKIPLADVLARHAEVYFLGRSLRGPSGLLLRSARAVPVHDEPVINALWRVEK